MLWRVIQKIHAPFDSMRILHFQEEQDFENIRCLEEYLDTWLVQLDTAQQAVDPVVPKMLFSGKIYASWYIKETKEQTMPITKEMIPAFIKKMPTSLHKKKKNFSW